MSLTVSGSTSAQYLQQIQATQRSGSASSVPPPIGGSTANISPAGQLFGSLQQLSQSNPTEFKAVATQLASSFQAAAQSATGSDAQALTGLANQFTQAAQTGQLTPPGGSGQAGPSQSGHASGHHHRHHHHGGGSDSQSSAIQQAFEQANAIVQQAGAGSSTTSTTTST